MIRNKATDSLKQMDPSMGRFGFVFIWMLAVFNRDVSYESKIIGTVYTRAADCKQNRNEKHQIFLFIAVQNRTELKFESRYLGKLGLE